MKHNALMISSIFILLTALPAIGLAGSATLHWQANSDSDLAGYRIYYGQQSRTYGPYVPVAKDKTRYVLNGLAEGKTYYFALTAVDTSGNESGYSAEVTKTITTQAGSSATSPTSTGSPTKQQPTSQSTTATPVTTQSPISNAAASSAPIPRPAIISTPPEPLTPVSVQILANNNDGVLITRPDRVVSLRISINKGGFSGGKADYWVSASTPFGSYSYVYGKGWQKGEKPAVQGPIGDLEHFLIFKNTLPEGSYEVAFAIDDNADGIKDNTWMDSVRIIVIP